MAKQKQGDSAGDRYLSLLDILGFRSIVNHQRMEEIAIRLKTLQRWLRDFARDGTEHDDEDSHTFFLLFSDSILIYSERDAPLEGLLSVIRTTALFIHELIRMGFPVRGAVTHGELFVSGDRRVFFGEGLVRAYELEQGQKWVGAIIDPALRGRSGEEDYTLDLLASQGEVRTYPVPWRTSPSPRDHLTVNWPSGIHGLDPSDVRDQLRDLDADPSEDARAMQEEAISYIADWHAIDRPTEEQSQHARSAIAFLKESDRWDEQPDGFRRILQQHARSDGDGEA